MSQMRITGAPTKYVQGPGVLSEIAVHVSLLGKRSLLLVDRGVISSVGERIMANLDRAGVRGLAIEFRGEITEAKVKRLKTEADTLMRRPDFVIAAGGGKALDMGKMLASRYAVPVVIVPTIASTDAPTSAISVLYNEDGSYQRYEKHPFNPAVIIVDTEVIANAPSRFLAAGIGDAISKKFEVPAAIAAGKLNFHRGAPPFFVPLLAEYAYDTVLAHGAAAKRSVDEKRVTEELERVVEAIILVSGMAFENGGMMGAHGMADVFRSNGFGHSLMHGEMVGLMTLIQMRLMSAPEEEISAVRKLFSEVGLPVSLVAIGLPEADGGRRKIAEDIHANMEASPFDCSVEAVVRAIKETG